MRRSRQALPAIAAATVLFSTGAAHADAAAGAELARRWCASCHLIGETNPTAPVPQGPPPLRSVVRSGMTQDQLRTFLSHPHGKMPDLSLTRAEIDDLVAYIQTLR